jgi:ectoine hydroxylase-related dioxygenase (phytanoyl-CoA dioxygenase family)
MNSEQYTQELNKNGYVFLPNLITPQECAHFRSLLERDYEKYASSYADASTATKGSLADKSGEKVVFNLHNKDISWFTLFEHPMVLAVLDGVLKEGSYANNEPYYMYNSSARCPLKGDQGQQLHIDSNLPGVNYPLIVNVLWMLDDFTLDNGATRIVPESHTWQRYAKDGEVHKDEIRITGEQGGAIIFNANIWHGGGANLNGASRWAVALGYARWFIKPSFDFMQNTPEEIFSALSEKQKDLLGFRAVPPKDEFTRLRRRSENFEKPEPYKLPF